MYDVDMEKDDSSEFAENEDYSENELFLKGPPFNPKDYMISPSESVVSSIRDITSSKKKLRPIDLKIDNFDLDACKALKILQSLIRDKLGRNLIKRQRNLIRIVIKGNHTGFLMEDISAVTEITEFFACNHKSVPDYVEFVKMLLKVAMNPPILLKSSEILKFDSEFSNYFTMLGKLLVIFEDMYIQCQILEVLKYLLIRPRPVDIQCVKLAHCYAAIEKSLLPYILASMLETVPDNLYQKYLEISLQIILSSAELGAVMIHTGAMEFILLRLYPSFNGPYHDIASMTASPSEQDSFVENDNSELLVLSGHVLWVFLTVISNLQMTCETPTCRALRSLRYAFRAEVLKQNKEAIHTRNNLAGIIMKLYDVFGDKLPIIQSGLAVDVALLSVATEIGTKNTWAKDVTFTSSREDYVLKKMMMMCCYVLSKNPDMIEIIKQQKVLEGVLHLINPGLTKLTVPWLPSQFLRLFLIALPMISVLVPLLPDVYVSNKGNTRMLMAVEWFMEEHFDKSPLLETLKTLCAVVICESNDSVVQDLKEQFGIKTLLNICFYILDSQPLRSEHQENLARIFVILERLCRNERKIEACMGNMYVTVSIKFLQRILYSKEDDFKTDPRMLICFSGFIWESMAWCPTLLRSFSEQKGIFLLLDLIEISSFPVQIMILGTLVDMADEGEIITHLLTWRDKKGYGILNMMIEIWKREEFLNKVPRTESGVIADVERPLMTDEQWYLTNQVHKAHVFSPAIAEMMCNTRPKIHSLYRLLRDRYSDLTHLNESLYSIFFEVVEPHNQVYIPLIERFFTLKMGEIWYEIYNEMNVSGLIPCCFDGETISALIDEKNKWAVRLKTMQEEILTYQKLHESDSEGRLYRLIKSSCLTNALDAMHELDYLCRTSDKGIQTLKKEEQLKEIDDTLIIPHESDQNHIHRSVLRSTNVTYLCGKYVWFKSEKEASLNSDIIQPVSPDPGSCNILNDEFDTKRLKIVATSQGLVKDCSSIAELGNKLPFGAERISRYCF